MMASGPFVSLDLVPWRPELASRETPEDLLIAREEEDEEEDDDAIRSRAVARELALEKMKQQFSRIPPREALALMLHLGILGYSRTMQVDIAEYLGVRSQQLVSYMVCRARGRLRYLAARPEVDFAVLGRVLSPTKVAIVRAVFETASFTEVARRRWPCPDERTRAERRVWERTRARWVKRDFFRALSKVEGRGLDAQSAALRHLLEHLGSLSYHAGKGTWLRAPRRSDRGKVTVAAPSQSARAA